MVHHNHLDIVLLRLHFEAQFPDVGQGTNVARLGWSRSLKSGVANIVMS
jgi:hypothetical protein